MRRLVQAGLLVTMASLAPAAEPLANLRQQVARDLGASWTVTVDTDTLRPRRLVGGSIPLVVPPPSGSPCLGVDSPVASSVRTLLAEHADLLGVDASALQLASGGPARVHAPLDILVFDIAPHGVRVAGGRVVAVVSHGNLIALHLTGTSPVVARPVPTIPREQAIAAATIEDVQSVELVFLPEQRSHRLAWQVTGLQDLRRMVARVDAGSGAVLSKTDETVEACVPTPSSGVERRVLAGVRRERCDEPERVELLAAATVGSAVSARDGFFTPGGLDHGTLAGPRAVVECLACVDPPSASAAPSANGDVDFGSGGRDAVGNGRAAPADRSAFFHVEGVHRLTSGWLDVPWLRAPLPIRTNAAGACNAWWDGNALTFMRSSSSCGNTGEIRDVIVHEWAHGLDQNDGLAPSALADDAATGEAVADLLAMLRSRDACIGESFNLSGGGPSDTCTGVRDLDEASAGHRRGTMSTANVARACSGHPFYRGPLGREGHCEGEILGQAGWHLVQNLITGISGTTGAPLPDPPLPEDAAWRVMERLYFASRPMLASYAPSSMQSIGMSAYDAFLLADDEGDGVANGTPHAAAIHDAFAHHGIAELAVSPPDTASCVIPVPDVTTSRATDPSTGLPAASVVWTDAGAAQYRLLRADGEGEALLPIAIVDASGARSFLDRAVLPGRAYRHAVVAEDATGCISAPASAAAITLSGPSLTLVALTVDDSISGDGDGRLRDLETARLLVDLRNTGDAAATNVAVTLESLDPGLLVVDPGPAALGTLAVGEAAQAAFVVSATTSAAQHVAVLAVAAADEGCLQDQGVLEVARPALRVAGHRVDDSTGNGGSTWDAGESIALLIALRNMGLLDAAVVTGTLSFRGTRPPGVHIDQPRADWPDIPAHASIESMAPSFLLRAEAFVPVGTQVLLTLDLSLGGLPHRREDVSVTVGGFPAADLEWRYEPPGTTAYCMTPMVIQLTDDDGDGVITACDVPDVVAQGRLSNGAGPAWLFAVSGDDGGFLWRCDPPTSLSLNTSLAAGDVDADGLNEIVVLDRDMHAIAVASDGRVKWVSPVPAQASQRQLYKFAAPQIWDLDSDGAPEVIIGATVLDGLTGDLEWENDRINSGRVVVGDLDLNGLPEILVGGTADDGPGITLDIDGNELPLDFAGFTGRGGLVNVDADPRPELVHVNDEPAIVVADDDGTTLYAQYVGDPSWPMQVAPCVGDLDGDGSLEVVVATTTSLLARHVDGRFAWRATIRDLSRGAGCTIFDFQGDGLPEVVHRDEFHLRILDGVDGTVLWQTEVGSATGFEVPVIVDVDADGAAEIVVTGQAWRGSPGPTGLLAFGNPAWAAARRVWNQEDYHGSNVEDDGSVARMHARYWLSPRMFNGQTTSCACSSLDCTFTITRQDCGPQIACFAAMLNPAGFAADVTWDFGDGTAAAGPTPCHEFATRGPHHVRATARDRRGCALTAEILVDFEPVAIEVQRRETCWSEETCLTATPRGTAPIEVSWDFLDGTPPVAGATACRLLPVGDHDVRVFARDARGCVAERDLRVAVLDPLVIAATEVSGPAGPPLRVRREGLELVVSFEAVPFEVGIYGGAVQRLAQDGYTHAATRACAVAGMETRLQIPSLDTYLLAVAAACDPILEGTYGNDTFGRPRPSAADLGLAACP